MLIFNKNCELVCKLGTGWWMILPGKVRYLWKQTSIGHWSATGKVNPTWDNCSLCDRDTTNAAIVKCCIFRAQFFSFRFFLENDQLKAPLNNCNVRFVWMDYIVWCPILNTSCFYEFNKVVKPLHCFFKFILTIIKVLGLPKFDKFLTYFMPAIWVS
jgi:hypothetical protein